jgi:hypothetical protein
MALRQVRKCSRLRRKTWLDDGEYSAAVTTGLLMVLPIPVVKDEPGAKQRHWVLTGLNSIINGIAEIRNAGFGVGHTRRLRSP